EYLPGSLQGKISSDGCLKKEQMVVSAIASTPQLLKFIPVACLMLVVVRQQMLPSTMVQF
ncbi:hypothetical protein NEP09_24665, partial [Escherichia coli]|nr:hypothetical protein [Escherichia coli]MDI0752121.1 hypothetical protein [Escherichia coli]